MKNNVTMLFAILMFAIVTWSGKAQAQITNLVASSDATNVYYSYSYSGTQSFLRVYLDTDRNAGTGFLRGGIGADYLIENNNLYKYSGTNGAWGWTYQRASNMVKPTSTSVRWTVARTSLGSPAGVNLIANYGDTVYSAIVSQSLSTTTTTTTTLPPTTVTWTRCASEGGVCYFSGTRQVRYGANGTYAYKTATGSIACDNATFGDPVYGVVKACDYSSNVTSTSTTLAPTTTTMAPTTTTTVPASTGSFTKPTLINPVSPITYGAKCDGVTDDSAAFAAAMRASDVLVPAGRTCVINREVQVTVTNRHLECGTDTILRMTSTSGRMFNYIAPSGARLSGNSIVNCHFIGANTVAPQADWNDPGKHYNIPVQTQDRVDNFFLAGNTFERFWGQSMFQTYGAVDGGRGDKIIYNTFKSCGYYGPVFVAHQNGTIANNTLVDCAAGVENDGPTQLTGGIVIENNVLTCIYGYGGYDMGACTMLTGGATENGANYSTNIVRYNNVSGTSSYLGFQGVRGSRLIGGANWGVPAAQYISNVCNNGCVYTP